MRILLSKRRVYERGQITIFVVLGLATFILAFVGLATDYSTFWYKRQAVQGAADASCQAAAMDLLAYASGAPTSGAGTMNFDPKNGPVVCSTSPTAAPCVIAAYNGFDATVAGNTVGMTFPTTVTNPPPGNPGVAYPYVKVDVTNNSPAYFTKIFTRNPTVPVHASATCGLGAPDGPVPIVVLHPKMTDSVHMTGSNDLIKVQGGPKRSIQVNSVAAEANYLASIDLSTAGPDGSGGQYATYGGPSTWQAATKGTFSWGTAGAQWVYPAAPIADPYRDISQPSKPGNGTITTGCYAGAGKCNKPGLSDCVANPALAGCYKVNGCPDPSGCAEYTQGYYGPNGVDIKNSTAIFDPGLYYIEGGLTLDSNSTVRTSTANGDGSGGIMFFLKGSPSGKCSGTSNASLCINSNSGTGGNGSNAVDAYYVDGSNSPGGVPSRALQCPGGGSNPNGLPATITGNVLLGPCPGTNGISVTYGDPSAQYRGFILWQDRAAVGNAQWQGGGQSLVSGFMYFHQCHPDGTGTEPCADPSSGNGFGDTFNLGGNPGSASFTLGSIVTDAIATNGTPNITLILSPANSFPTLRVYLIQ